MKDILDALEKHKNRLNSYDPATGHHEFDPIKMARFEGFCTALKMIQDLEGGMDCKLNRFIDDMRENSDSDTASVTIFINCEGHEITINKRDRDDLKRSSISMRNLRGEWIK